MEKLQIRRLVNSMMAKSGQGLFSESADPIDGAKLGDE
jgi:hypothetical protein